MPSIIYVHGTGVRDEVTYKIVEKALPSYSVVNCFWGQDHGVDLHRGGKSIPGYMAQANWSEEEKAETQWELLYREPLIELLQSASLTVKPDDVPPPLPWEELKTKIEAYQRSAPLAALLEQAQLNALWPEAFQAIVFQEKTVFESALKKFTLNHDQPIILIARAIIASAISIGLQRNLPLPDADTRDDLVERLAADFGKKHYKSSLGTAVAYYLRPLTWVAERKRAVLSDGAFPAAGDILLYQRRGEDIRDFIEAEILKASRKRNGEKVVLLAHSLGGIACFDLLAKNPDMPVEALITVGSQAPLLYELDCLWSLRCKEMLRSDFPRWLNIFDQQDFLSYIAEDVFPGHEQIEDFEVRSGQPFPISHGAYWQIGEFWKKVRGWIV
ncbi:MAG: hypothetical protein SF339_05715 [Blastocatellia bacterium]|nr:hypothetical protein [Blastocatellia bacterium]